MPASFTTSGRINAEFLRQRALCPHDRTSRGCIDSGFARICGPRGSNPQKYPRAPRVNLVLGEDKGPGGLPYPRAARTLLLTHILACNTSFFRAPFSLQTPVERSECVAGCWTVRARANPLSLGVWPFTLRFVLPGVGLATRADGRKAVVCSRPLDPKSTSLSTNYT